MSCRTFFEAPLEALIRTSVIGLWGLLAMASASLAQAPDIPWRTLETAHFRFHYPAAAEEWTRRVAAQAEAIRERVVAEVGFAPAERVEVLVVDPTARANGVAWPILGRPRMVLFTTPPAPDSVLGHYRDWGEVLTAHEVTHLAHLLRPSRNRLLGLAGRLIPVGPLPQQAPRWVIEGYATLVEGRLTGYGRPHGDLRASILRRWAQLGELPTYGQLSGDGRRWMGRSTPYLVGSAYLEWLVARTDDDSLRRLWRRMSAKQRRGFDAAFRGVFGDSSRALYNRFCAELTYRAMTLEAELKPQLAEGELWHDSSWQPSAPSVSPTGDRLVMALQSRQQPPRLVVWSTRVDQEALTRRAEAREELAADPEDVAADDRGAPPHEVLHERVFARGAAPMSPRFMADGNAVLFVRMEPDGDGFQHPDLFLWRLQQDRVERLTWGADVRDADPAPDGSWAVAVRHRWGTSQLVRVDLASGQVRALTEASAAVVYSHPRVAGDGQHIAVARHAEGRWQLIVRHLDGGLEDGGLEEGHEIVLPVPERATVAHPSWTADLQVLAAIGEGGFIDVFAFTPLTPGPAVRLTRTLGAALAPTASPDGSGFFFLGLEADGLDLRWAGRAPAPADGSWTVQGREADLVPAVRPPVQTAAMPATAELADSQPYGAGPMEHLPLVGGGYGPDGSSFEFGLRSGDPVGRLEILTLGSVASHSAEGGALAVRWQGWPVTLAVRLFSAREHPDGAAPIRRQGLALDADWAWGTRRSAVRLSGGVYAGDLEVGTVEASQRLIHAGVVAAGRLGREPWHFRPRLAVRGTRGTRGSTAGHSWQRWRAALDGRVIYAPVDGPRFELGLGWSYGQADDAMGVDRFQLGGRMESLQAPSAIGGRIFEPALPLAAMTGDRFEAQRAELRLGGWPLRLFYRRYRLWDAAQTKDDWLMLRGLELRFAGRAMPLLRLPAVRVHLGVAEWLDQPYEGEIEGWLSVSWRQ